MEKVLVQKTPLCSSASRHGTACSIAVRGRGCTEPFLHASGVAWRELREKAYCGNHLFSVSVVWCAGVAAVLSSDPPCTELSLLLIKKGVSGKDG